jgi:hypothetical protein
MAAEADEVTMGKAEGECCVHLYYLDVAKESL